MKSFLMIGQSNMAGRGDFGEVPEIKNSKCFMLRNGKFIPMSEPINPDRAIWGDFHSGVGLAASFADEYAKHFNEDIGLIPCADGGTSISQWQPGEVLFDNAVNQAKLAKRSSEIVGILWHQGENDSINIQDVNLYRERFEKMLSALIEEIGLSENTPVIVGKLGDFVGKYANGKCKYSTKINEILGQIAKEFPSRDIASADGLICKDDGIHFNSSSYRELGKRYFEAFLRIKGK